MRSISPSIDQPGVFSISVYSTAPTADSPDSREEFRLSLPSNELMPVETKAQTATVVAAAVATNDTNGKGEGLQLIDPRKNKTKLWQILPDECTGKPSERPDKHAGSYGGGGASGGYDRTGSGRGDEGQRWKWTGTGCIDPRKKKAELWQNFPDDCTHQLDEHVDYYDWKQLHGSSSVLWTGANMAKAAGGSSRTAPPSSSPFRSAAEKSEEDDTSAAAVSNDEV